MSAPPEEEVNAALVAYWGSKSAARKYGCAHDMRMALIAAEKVRVARIGE